MKRKKRQRGSRRLFFGAIIVTIVIILLVITTPSSSLVDKSVIIFDTLATPTGKETFTTRCRAVLEPAGYTIKTYTGSNVTVDQVKALDSNPIVIMRVHSSVFDEGVWFYTGEPYSNAEHVLEQLTNELHIGRTSSTANFTFVVGSTFIRNNLKTRLNGTLVILMGCHGLSRSDLAEAFTDSGASAYVSWSGPVTIEQTDEATLKMLQELVDDRASLDEAIHFAMFDSFGFNSTLLAYPEGVTFTLKGD